MNKKNELTEKEFVAFCQDQFMELLPRVFVQFVGSLLLAPFVALLMYAIFKLSIRMTTPSLLVSAFDHIPRALLTPLFASMFATFVLPLIVDAVESRYDSVLESQSAQNFKNLPVVKPDTPTIFKSKTIKTLVEGALEKFSDISQNTTTTLDHKATKEEDIGSKKNR